MGRKCGVESCLSDSNRLEDTGVTFHKVPMHPDIRPKWMSLCRIPEDKKDVKVIYICSRHFLSADFCNFKGKKYMLKQGVLPSVFPWNKLRADSEPRMTTVKKEMTESEHQEVKPEPFSNSCDSSQESIDARENMVDVNNQQVTSENSKEKLVSAQSTTIEQKIKSVQTSFGLLNFAINSRIEALDFNEMWYPARIVEIDYEENEVLIHFEKYSSKYDEWICMDSARLRPLQSVASKLTLSKAFTTGERCMASWSDARKFPATVQRVIDDGKLLLLIIRVCSTFCKFK